MYSLQQCSYYSALVRRHPESVIGYNGGPIGTYSAFGEPGAHNGIRISEKQVKDSFTVLI
jgi:hypothetical protein